MGPRRLICLMLAAQIATTAPALAQEADPAEPAAPVPARLTGLDEAGVRAALGEPTLARAEGAGAFWTYRLPRCALFVYFADEGRGLRVTGVASGPRRHGETAPNVEACRAEAPGPSPH